MVRKKDDKGRKGERDFVKTIIKIEDVGEDIDFKKPTYTNEPDGGLDIEIKCGHNIGEVFNAIIKDENKVMPLSDTKINVRVDVKNYDGKIGKPIAQKFVNDCKRNPQNAEHWLVGGEGLTKGAKDVMDNSEYVCRYYSQEDINKIDNHYQNLLENVNESDND